MAAVAEAVLPARAIRKGREEVFSEQIERINQD
jgi:hypothetical protein